MGNMAEGKGHGAEGMDYKYMIAEFGFGISDRGLRKMKY
jgi:hypothetical protein